MNDYDQSEESVQINLSPSPSDDSTSSEDNIHRKELLWQKREELLLREWMENMFIQSKKHRKKGDKFKSLYKIFGIPSILIPIALSSLSSQLEGKAVLNGMMMLLAGVCSGVSNFLNFGKLYSDHYNYEQLYDQMGQEIKKELSKPKCHRVACDVYVERCYLKFMSLNEGAPNV